MRAAGEWWMNGLERILIVGGGIAGMASAIRLREAGVAVDLIDLDPQWRVYGAGITITGPTLRAYKRLGLIEAIKAEGAISNATRIYRYDGLLLRELDEPSLEEGLPATGGIMRPVLHRIMQERVNALGTTVRLGLTVVALVDDDDGVSVTFSDGSIARYDLVLGASPCPRVSRTQADQADRPGLLANHLAAPAGIRQGRILLRSSQSRRDYRLRAQRSLYVRPDRGPRAKADPR
jgi:2-polyprenyl-6-methoxyphenol hydroxylase-like FAD-dependent oxidoreductase